MSSKKGQKLSTKQKALKVNLDDAVYGSFSEIGAGQETVRQFFRAGRASGTICKAMSAYDKDFSDAIYGEEPFKRYVTEARLKKMLHHEISLLEERLPREKHPGKTFFSYANTVATSNRATKFKGHGWLGIKYQLDPNQDKYNEVIVHIKFLIDNPSLEQEILGNLGVNLMYGAFYLYENPKEMLISLMDNIRPGQIEIDMINFSGPTFKFVDNRLMSLMLMKYEMTEAVIFGPDGNNLLPAEHLYGKNILTLRGSFRPVTNVNMDMFQASYDMFVNQKGISPENTNVIFEITMNNLKSQGEINERDFLERADILCSLGHNVMVSNFSEYYKLVEYFSHQTNKRIGMTMGVSNLIEIFTEHYYENLGGGILESFGKLFMRDVQLYLYPYIDKINETIINIDNIKVHPRLKELYKYFKQNGNIIDIHTFKPEHLHVFSRDVLKRIKLGDKSWETMVPEQVAKFIKTKKLFGYNTIK